MEVLEETAVQAPGNEIPEIVPEEIEPEAGAADGVDDTSEGGDSQEKKKERDEQKAIDALYGVSEEESKERRLKLYEILKEKKIDTIAKVKEVLKEVLPDEDWSNIKRDVFEKMPPSKLSKVMEYLAE